MQSKYYAFIDGFRAIAVLAVLAFHGSELIPDQNAVFIGIKQFFSIGHLGVDTFFVLSGFLITGILIPEWNADIQIKRFYLRRIFKIIPHYYFVLLLSIGILYLSDPAIIQQIVRHADIRLRFISHFLFFQNYLKPVGILTHTWSLAIEEHFYLMYPLLVGAVFALQKNAERRRLLLIWISLILIGLVIVNRYLGNGQDYLLMKLGFQQLHPTPTFVRIDALLFGCVLKYLEPMYNQSKRAAGYLPGLFCMAGLLIYAGLIVFGIHPYYISQILAYLAAGFLFIAAYWNFKPLSTISNHKVLRMLGQNSYGIYLMHILTLFLMKPWQGYIPPVLLFSLYIGLSVLFGTLTTLSVERYFLKLRKKLVP